VTRDQLEALIWRESGRKLTAAQVDAILAAADDYARYECRVTAERRAVIAVRRPVKAGTKARYERAQRARRAAAC
jgi:hypothetical protein